MSNEMLERVISTSSIGASTVPGGFLSPEESGRFIDYMWDATTLGGQVRTVQMRSDTVEPDRMAIGERIVRLATEAVADPVQPTVAFTKVSITAVKLRVDWELSSESLEDGLEGDALEDHIARLIASQVANDLEDVAINGDVDGHSDDALLKSFDGWRKRLFYGGQVVDADGSTLGKAVFHRALRAMPRKYMGARGSLKWFTSAGLLQDYVYSAAFIQDVGQIAFTPQEQAQALNNGGIANANAGWSPTAPFGVRAQEVPLFPEYTLAGTTDNDGGTGSDVWLVDPKNLVWGVRRAVQVFREFKPKKDTIEYTLYTRVGCAVENPLASVVVRNVAYNDA